MPAKEEKITRKMLIGLVNDIDEVQKHLAEGLEIYNPMKEKFDVWSKAHAKATPEEIKANRPKMMDYVYTAVVADRENIAKLVPALWYRIGKAVGDASPTQMREIINAIFPTSEPIEK